MRSTFVAFLVFALVVVGGLHYFLWARLFRDTGLPRRARRVSAWLLAALFVSIPLANVVARWRGPKAWVWVSFTWMGLLFYLFLTLLVGDVVYLVAARGVDDGRRTFLRRALAGAASFVAVATSAYGVDQALKLARSAPPDLIIAEAGMTDDSAFEFLREIRSDLHLCEIPFIFVTSARADAASRALGLRLGANRYLLRPLPAQRLLDEVAMCVAESRGPRPRPPSPAA